MRTLLLVVSSPVRAEAVRGALAPHGWNVVDAENGPAALRALAARACDSVLIDAATVNPRVACEVLAAAETGLPLYVLANAGEEKLPAGATALINPALPPSKLSVRLAETHEEETADDVAPVAADGRQWTSEEIFGDLISDLQEGAEPEEPFPAVPAPAAAPPSEEETTSGGTLPSLGSYELLDRIAVGGMAEVWKAERHGAEGFRKTVAIKKIRRELTENRAFVRMFIQEAKLAASLHHDNIVEIYDLGRMDDEYCIAMEYVDGQDLRTLMNAATRARFKVPLPIALLLSARIVSALAYAHGRRASGDSGEGIVHCDVSPRNVLISREGHVKLCDFGIAKAAHLAEPAGKAALQGKVQYMSPEQASGERLDPRSDLFSFGVLLYELVTGRRPFAETPEETLLEAVKRAEPAPPRSIAPDLPPAVEEIILRCLRRTPAERYSSASGLQTALGMVLSDFEQRPGQADLVRWVSVVEEGRRADAEEGRGGRVDEETPADAVEESSTAPASTWGERFKGFFGR